MIILEEQIAKMNRFMYVRIIAGSLYCSLFSVSRCRLLPTVSFSVNFGYLFFFRCMYLVGFDPPTGPTNAVQLLLTLKVCSSVAAVLALVCCTMLGGDAYVWRTAFNKTNSVNWAMPMHNICCCFV